MLPKSKSFHARIALFVSLLFGGQWVLGNPPGITMDVKCEEASIFTGEPCVLAISFVNGSPTDTEIDLGWDGHGAFSFRILDRDRNQLAKGDRIPPPGGLSMSGRRSIVAGGSIRERVILNRWCGTLLEPGDYIVACTCTLEGQTEWVSECPLNVGAADPLEAESVFSEYLAIAAGAAGFADQMFGMDLLALANSPFVVPSLEKSVSMGELPEQFKSQAVDALERIGNVEAARSMVRLAQSSMEDRVSPDIRKILRGAACRLHERSPDLEVREVAGQIAGTTPCPERPVIYD